MIRQLTDADVSAYRALRLRALSEEPAAFGSAAEDFAARSDESIAQQLRNAGPADFVLGAFQAGELVGLVALFREQARKSRHQAHVAQMYVAPEGRGRGLARALMAELLARAGRAEGVEQVHLGVMTTMTAARALYLALGFTVYGREPRTLKLPDGYRDMDLMVLML